jgi:hypothetical protein
VALDEARQLLRALALGVVAHAGPDLDVRVRRGEPQACAWSARTSTSRSPHTAATGPEKRRPRWKNAEGERPAAASAWTAIATPALDHSPRRARRSSRSGGGRRPRAISVEYTAVTVSGLTSANGRESCAAWRMPGPP